jgi:hypothetical protein
MAEFYDDVASLRKRRISVYKSRLTVALSLSKRIGHRENVSQESTIWRSKWSVPNQGGGTLSDLELWLGGDADRWPKRKQTTEASLAGVWYGTEDDNYMTSQR